MSTLTREHRQALADIGGWPISGCLHSPDTAIPHLRCSMQGGSQLGERWPRGSGYQCGPRGIRVGTPSPRDAGFIIAWTALHAYAATISRSVREALRDVDARARRHQVDSPPWLRGEPEWVCAAWYRDVYQPWVIDDAALREQRTRLLSTALGLDHDEPEDLLELLAATSS